MILAYTVLMMVITLAVVAYPLFFRPVESFTTQKPEHREFHELDPVLNALSELEVDHQSGRVSDDDYLRLKAYFQQQYLLLKNQSESSKA